MFSPHYHQSRSWTMRMEGRPLSLQRDRSRRSLPRCSTLLSSCKVRHRNHLNVAGLLAGLPVAHGPSNPLLSSHHHPVGPLAGLSPHDTLGPMNTFPDAMNCHWPTPAASDVDAAYSEVPTPCEYDGPPAFARDDPSLFARAKSEGGLIGTTTSLRTVTLRCLPSSIMLVR